MGAAHVALALLPAGDGMMFSELPLGRKIVAIILLNLIMIPVSWAAYKLFHGWIPRPWSLYLGGAILVWSILYWMREGYLAIARRRRANVNLERLPLPRIGQERHRRATRRDQYLIDTSLRG